MLKQAFAFTLHQICRWDVFPGIKGKDLSAKKVKDQTTRPVPPRSEAPSIASNMEAQAKARRGAAKAAPDLLAQTFDLQDFEAAE